MSSLDPSASKSQSLARQRWKLQKKRNSAGGKPNKIRLETEDALKAYLLQSFGVRLPDKQVCSHHTTPFRAFADAYYGRDPIAIWKASRGFGGKTFMLSLLGLTEAASLQANVNILGGSDEQAKRVLDHRDEFKAHDGFPHSLVLPSQTLREMRFVAGNKIRTLTASTKSARGPHPQRLRIDEADETDIKIIDAAMGQTMASNGIIDNIVASSTHQYADGPMTELLQRAGENGWPVYEWCYKETQEPHGWLTDEAMERKRQVVTKYMWETEYDLQEPAPDSRAIMPAKVDKMFDADLGSYRGIIGERIIIEKPKKKGKYGIGADWARKQDKTVIVVMRFDVKPIRVVAYIKVNRADWPVMVSELVKLRKMYRKGKACKVIHDGTGIGDVIDGYLTFTATGFIMAGRPRADLLTEYINAVEKEEIISPMIESCHRGHKHASYGDVYQSGQQYHLPDDISAFAFAYRATGSFFHGDAERLFR